MARHHLVPSRPVRVRQHLERRVGDARWLQGFYRGGRPRLRWRRRGNEALGSRGGTGCGLGDGAPPPPGTGSPLPPPPPLPPDATTREDPQPNLGLPLTHTHTHMDARVRACGVRNRLRTMMTSKRDSRGPDRLVASEMGRPGRHAGFGLHAPSTVARVGSVATRPACMQGRGIRGTYMYIRTIIYRRQGLPPRLPPDVLFNSPRWPKILF